MSLFTVRVGDRGQVIVPEAARDEMGIEEGDELLLETDPMNGTLTYAVAENPLIRRAREALAEYKAGETVTLDDVAAELGFTIERE